MWGEGFNQIPMLSSGAMFGVKPWVVYGPSLTRNCSCYEQQNPNSQDSSLPTSMCLPIWFELQLPDFRSQ